MRKKREDVRRADQDYITELIGEAGNTLLEQFSNQAQELAMCINSRLDDLVFRSDDVAGKLKTDRLPVHSADASTATEGIGSQGSTTSDRTQSGSVPGNRHRRGAYVPIWDYQSDDSDSAEERCLGGFSKADLDFLQAVRPEALGHREDGSDELSDDTLALFYPDVASQTNLRRNSCGKGGQAAASEARPRNTFAYEDPRNVSQSSLDRLGAQLNKEAPARRTSRKGRKRR